MREAGEIISWWTHARKASGPPATLGSAVHLSKGIIERDIETKVPDKDATLILYCGGGFRSALVADNLQKMGYTHAISLDGGWRALKASGIPLE